MRYVLMILSLVGAYAFGFGVPAESVWPVFWTAIVLGIGTLVFAALARGSPEAGILALIGATLIGCAIFVWVGYDVATEDIHRAAVTDA